MVTLVPLRRQWRARSLHTTWPECMRQPNESKFLVKVVGAKYRKYGVKSSELEKNVHGTFVFISKFCSVTHTDFLHACSIKCSNSNTNVWRKVIRGGEFFVIQK